MTSKKAEGRVLKTYDDQHFGMGLVLLTDTGKVEPLQEVHGDNSFNAHALQQQPEPGVQTNLLIFKMGKFYKLASSAQETSVAYDSEFHLFRASDTLLGVNEEGDEKEVKAEEEDLHLHMADAGNKKDYSTVLMITSKQAEVTRLFPIIKKKSEQGIIEDIHLETTATHTKELIFQSD